MLLVDYAAFAHCLGWLAALMFAALVPSLPGSRGRKHAGWLIAFCAARLLVAAQGLLGAATSYEVQTFGAVVSGMLLWEFARRFWNETQPRSISAATHLVAVECLILMAAAHGAARGARPEWFFPVDLLFAVLPALLGGAAMLALWRCLDRTTLRLAAIGLGLFGLAAVPGGVAIGGVLAPWLVAGGLAGACFAVPAVRTRAAFLWIAGLLVACAVGPLIVAANLRRIDEAQGGDLLARAQQAVAPLQGRIAASLADKAASRGFTDRAWHEQIATLRASDPLLHEARLWKLQGERIVTLVEPRAGVSDWVVARAATAEEKSHASGLRPFITRTATPNHRHLISTHGPLSSAAFETPVAWLALDYAEEFWTVQREHARRNGVALIGVLAAFCAMGFVLAGRHAIENAQRLTMERVQAADKAKTEFLAFLSHELRTPLQTILGRAELLRRENPDGTPRRHANTIEAQGRLLLRLVNDLLDLGTIEAGKLALRPAPFRLRTLLASLEETHAPLAAEKNLALTIEAAPDVPDALIGDETRLRQVLGNLVGNALKFTASGRVTLRVITGDSGQTTGDRPCHLIFTVADTGPGLPPDKIPQLFTLFTRLDSGKSFRREGTGVGLALVRRLCDLMGGSVSAANRAEGGAEFTVRIAFPVAGTGEAIAENVSAIVPGASATRRVLVVEDNTAAREFLGEALAALGCAVEGVGDGESALAACAARTFDAVVLDLNLPGCDGIAVARALVAHRNRPRIIGCSAEAFAPAREAALAAGMDVFLEKPVSLAVLAEALGASVAPPLAIESANLFERLRSTEMSAQARITLMRELPVALDQLRAARRTGDASALRRNAHRLRSTALLANHAAIDELCLRLERAAASDANGEVALIIAELSRHLVPIPE